MVIHTPGPWRIKTDSVWENICSTIVRVGGIEIMAPQSQLAYSDQQNEANARLIASAPELLLACKLAWPLIHDKWDTKNPAQTKAIRALESAINKAEGK